jgi:hypothetical protein
MYTLYAMYQYTCMYIVLDAYGPADSVQSTGGTHLPIQTIDTVPHRKTQDLL